jgi:hypothetical protein
MSETMSYRRMHPIAQQLVGKIFDAIAQEVEDLVAMDRSKMSLVGRGRWSVQVLRLLKTLQKDYPEASESTKEGRQAINRLKTPEELEVEAAALDALLGLPSRTPPKTDQRSAASEPILAGQTSSSRQGLTRPESSIGTSERQKTACETAVARASVFPDVSEDPRAIDGDTEIAEILRRVRPSATSPPS